MKLEQNQPTQIILTVVTIWSRLIQLICIRQEKSLKIKNNLKIKLILQFKLIEKNLPNSSV